MILLVLSCSGSNMFQACLTAVGPSQVWAGTFAGIHVIDSETITCNKVLSDHADLVVDIVLYNQNRYNFCSYLYMYPSM